MPTVIDSLQIEIQSGSANAKQKIDDLAEALEKLNTKGKTTSVIKRLKALSDGLDDFGDSSNAVESLRALKGALEGLSQVKSIAGIANNLKKLPGALKLIDSIDSGRMESQFRGIASAASYLSGIKTSGLSSMVNSLSKITKVTNELDDDKIAAFAERVKKLNEVLAPLSEKMKTVGSGFSAINSGAGKASRAVKEFDQGVNTTTHNLSNLIDVVKNTAQSIMHLVQQFVEFLSVAIEWDGIKAQFGNAFGDQADEYYKKITKLTDALMINKQAFMENSAMAASMLIGFGVGESDAREMGLGYTQLAYDIWAAFNNVYKTLDGADGAMAAVRSAIAGEVEPIRRAGFTIVESTLAQTAANHGLNISIEKATEAQKSYLRYLTLVDQAQSKGVIGTYAREMKTAEGMMRTFSQQLKTLAQAFGSLFLPILTKVMPYLQAFIELLTDGVRALAAFFGIKIQDIGDTWNDYSTGVDSAIEGTDAVTGALGDATEAAKALKNAAIGIDELNVISPPTASSGSGGGAGGAGAGGSAWDDLDVESLWDESIINDIKSQVDSIKEKFKDWLPTIASIGSAIGAIRLTKLLDDLDLSDTKFAKLENVIKGLGKGLAISSIAIAVGTLVWDFTGAYLEGGSEADLLKALGTTTLGVALAYWLGGKPGAAFTLTVSGVVTLSRLVVELREGSVEWGDSETIITALIGGVETIIGSVFAWKTLAPMLKSAWPKIASAATQVLSKAGPYGWVAAAVVAGLTLAFVDYDFSKVGEALGETIGKGLKAAGKFIGESITSAWNWIVSELDIEDFWDVLAYIFIPGKSFEALRKLLDEPFATLSEWINEKIENLKGNINEFFAGFFDGLFDGLGLDVSWAKEFAEIFDIDYLDIVESFVNPSSIGTNVVSGIVNAMNKNGIKDKFSVMWDEAKKWWDKKPALSTYTPSIGKIWEKLKTAWEEAKNWWNKNRSSLSYTPSIGKIWENLKSAWTTAKDWWNKNRSSLSYTPTIGSIKNKLSTAWTTAKDWWNKNRSSLSYTPTIGSIKDKVSSAWATAKNWWNNNVGGLSTKLNIKVPTISVKWKTAEAFGKEFRYPTGFELKFAANGGIFDAGSLIWAGERGAEIVANAGGGKTGVMNVAQMQDAVYEGVYAAMAAVMSKYSGEGATGVNVYLDSRQITSTVEQRQREKGASLMGNEVFA